MADSAAAAPAACVRLFVGGLPVGVRAEELVQRFASFGAVSAVQLVPAKQLGGGVDGARVHAFFDLQPNAADRDVQRCISTVRRAASGVCNAFTRCC